MARLLAWIGIALAASYLVFVSGAGQGIYTTDLRLIAVILAAVALAAWAVVAYRTPGWRPRSALLPAILVSLASIAIATAFSRVPRVSVEYLAYAIVLAALYLLLVRLFASPFFRTRLLALSWTLFTLIAVAYVVVVVARWISWWDVLGHVAIPPLRPEYESLTFGNPAHVLMMVGLLAVPTVASSGWTTRRGIAVFATVLGLTAIVAILSGTRAGWLALAAAGVVGIVLLLVVYRTELRSSFAAPRRAMGRRTQVALGLGVAGVVIVGVALAPAILRRASEGGEGLRTTYVDIAGRMFRDAPVTGIGPGAWVDQRIVFTEAHEVDYYIPHAHSIYAQTLAEQGLVGVVAGIVVVGSLAWLLAGAIRGTDPSRRRWGIATAVGLTYFGAHHALDFMVNLPAVLFALAIPIAYLDATATDRMPLTRRLGPPRMLQGPRWRSIAGAAALVVTAVALGGVVVQELPARDAATAVAEANAGRWENARQPALAAAAADPAMTSFLFTAGLAEAHAGNHAAAADLFRRVATATDLPEAWLNLASEDLEAGNTTAVPASLQAALRLGRQRPAVAIAAGELALRIGDQATAIDAFSAAAVTSPSILADPWWREDPDRIPVHGLVSNNAATVAGPERAWEVALMSGNAREAANLAPDTARHDFVLAWGGDDEARARLESTCEAQPLNIAVLLLCARAEGRAGNLERANEFRYLANVQIGGAYSAGAELRVNDREVVGRSLEGDPAIFWGTYTYRRPTPWDVLVPSLVHLSLE